MNDEEVIERVTAVLTPPARVGDTVTVNWDTVLFKRCNVYKIENGWFFLKSLDNQHSCVASPTQIRLL